MGMAIRSRKVRKGRNSAAQAKRLTSQALVEVLPAEHPGISPTVVANGSVEAKVNPNAEFTAQMDWDDVRLTAARLYGRGYKRAAIARALLEHLVPPNTKARTEEQKLSQAYQKLRRWERAQEFRDLVFQHAVVQLDMETPAILVGLSKRAKRGRVDAARLALEITGRHTKEDQSSVTNVTINLANVPRPE
jgi:hypothetical protein